VNFDEGEELQAVRSAFATFFAREAGPAAARAAEPLGFSPTLWKQILLTGAASMGVGAKYGGDGASLVELAVVCEEMGAAIAPAPLVEHMVASRLFPAPDVVAGTSVATVALRPANSGGEWFMVPAGAIADIVIGLVGSDVVCVRSTPSHTPVDNHACSPIGNRRTDFPDRTVLDLTASDIERAKAEWQVLTAASLVGIAQSALDIGVAYALSREQFGVPIGSFQSIQHALADLPALIIGARLLSHKAAWAAQAGSGVVDPDSNEFGDFTTLASMAFLFASRAATRATDVALHVHGGAGFAREYDIQLFYRRARGWSLIYGDPGREAVELARRMFVWTKGS
jgi:alkylation response protein AidB-like acyl-CoA dehydrogenase